MISKTQDNRRFNFHKPEKKPLRKELVKFTNLILSGKDSWVYNWFTQVIPIESVGRGSIQSRWLLTSKQKRIISYRFLAATRSNPNSFSYEGENGWKKIRKKRQNEFCNIKNESLLLKLLFVMSKFIASFYNAQTRLMTSYNKINSWKEAFDYNKFGIMTFFQYNHL